MGVSGLIGGVVILSVAFAIVYVVMNKFFKLTRELGDEHREQISRKRSLDPSQLRSVEEHVATPPPPPAASPGAAVLPFNPNLSPAARQMVEEMHAQAKTRDEAHKSQIRDHFERPVPPITDEGREAIERGKQARLAIKHIFPPRLPQRSMSYFGGLPIVPDEFDWPTVHNREGLLERLNFMAQIDCSDLPPGPARDLLPDKGYLYFFAPMSLSFGEDALHFVTRYEPGPVKKSWEPLDMPATGKIEPGDPIEVAWRGRRTHYDKVEIAFGWIEEPSDEEVAARGDEGHAFEVAQKLRAEKQDAFYGPIPPPNVMMSAYQAPKDKLWTPYAGFPANWSTARILHKLIYGYYSEEYEDVAGRLKALGEVAEDDPEAQRLKGLQSELWAMNRKISDALSPTINLNNKDYDAPPDEVKQTILEFLEELRVNGMPSSKERHYSHHALPMVLNDWLSIAAIHGAEGGLTDPEGAAHIPAEVVAALAARHSAREHQMLGEGAVVQVAADEMKDRYVLLLQLGPDRALNWLVGEMGPLQYWITPEDLAAKRFENTVLTIEAY